MDLLVDEEDVRMNIAVELCADLEVEWLCGCEEEVAVDDLSDLEGEAEEDGSGC